MYQLNFRENKMLMYISAISFPDDILNAHQELHTMVTEKKGRDYFGISFSDSSGKIQYKAAVTQNYDGEAAALGLKTYLLKKGIYNYITVPNYKDDIVAIEKAFKILLLNPKIDPNGACVEWYFNDNDVKCMVRNQ
jgi:hypothetical protein